MSTDNQAAHQPMALNDAMSSSLDSALSKLAAVQTPVPEHPEVRAEARLAESSKTVAEPTAPAPVPEQTVTEVKSEAPAPAAPIWGPQQAKALQDILQSNESMTKELEQMKAEAAKYKGLVERAQDGDILGFAEETQLSPDDLQSALQNKGKVPVSRPYVRKLETTVETLSQRIDAMQRQFQERQAAMEQADKLRSITTHLQQKPEYGILRQIPDVGERLHAIMAQRESEARARGEATAITVDQAAKMLRDSLIGNLKQFLTDETVRQELGFAPSESVTPATVKPPRSSKAITSEMSSQGSPTKTTVGYDPEQMLRRALKRIGG